MKISTRGRYAIRVMLDLAEHNNGEYIPLMDIAKRQEISEKYLESIVSVWSGLLLNIRSEVSCVSRKVQWHRLPVWMIIRISARERHPAKHCRCGKVSISCSMNILTELLWKTFWSRAQIQETM